MDGVSPKDSPEPPVKPGVQPFANWVFTLLHSKFMGFFSCEQRLHNVTVLLHMGFCVAIFLSCMSPAWIDSPYYPKAAFTLSLYRDFSGIVLIPGLWETHLQLTQLPDL